MVKGNIIKSPAEQTFATPLCATTYMHKELNISIPDLTRQKYENKFILSSIAFEVGIFYRKC